MRKHLWCIVIVIALINPVLAGDDQRIGTLIHLPLFAVQQPADMVSPFSGMVQALPAHIGSANPAAITNFNRPLSGFALEYRTPIYFNQDISTEADHPWLPASAVVVWPLAGWHLGLTYQNGYSEYTDFGKMEITTPEMPEGTGEFIFPYHKNNLYAAGLIAAKALNGVFSATDRLSLAIQPMVHYLDIYYKIGSLQATYSDLNLGVRAGLIYQFNPSAGLGLSYQSGPRFKAEFKFKPEFAYNTNEPTKDNAGFADRLALGGQIRFGMITLRSALAYLWYEPAFSNYDYGWQYALKASIRPLPALAFGLGAFVEQTKAANYSPNPTINWLSAVVRYRLPLAELLLEVADSHLRSSEDYRQTIVRFAFNVPLTGSFGLAKEDER